MPWPAKICFTDIADEDPVFFPTKLDFLPEIFSDSFFALFLFEVKKIVPCAADGGRSSVLQASDRGIRKETIVFVIIENKDSSTSIQNGSNRMPKIHF